MLVLVSIMAALSTSLVGIGAAGATTSGRRVQAPKTTLAEESAYLLDVAKADPTLETYAQSGQLADRALLTDGVALCVYLKRGGGIDNALTSVADGAESIESKTHLPLSVTTFNTIDAVALVTLCPSEQTLIPSADRTRIRRLGRALSGTAG